MNKTDLNLPVCAVLELLPRALSREIEALAGGRVGGLSAIREIRVRGGGVSSAVISGGQLPLFYTVSEAELYAIASRLTDSSLFAHRDTLGRGYLTMPRGIRVGVCGRARAEGKSRTLSDISALVFRIPTGRCDFSRELYEAYEKATGGMLIYSPPGGGKTTALRSLATDIGRAGGVRVVVVDEREEFSREDFLRLGVDILSGYSRAEGIALAVRTLGAELIMVDELMGEECSEIEYSALSGVPVIATAHAGSFSEVLSKRELGELISRGVFSTFVGISERRGRYTIEVREELRGCLSI